jgi:hypothetical protein
MEYIYFPNAFFVSFHTYWHWNTFTSDTNTFVTKLTTPQTTKTTLDAVVAQSV